MRILVTGASGGLGGYVVRALRGRGCKDLLTPLRAELDVADEISAQRYMSKWRPDATIHLAAMTDVAGCERHPTAATLANALGTRFLARAALGYVLLMSTNDLFSGLDEPGPFDESANPSPRGVYAWTKFAAEQAVLGRGGGVIRANFFTRRCNGKRSFAEHVLATARSSEPVPCYRNVRATPVFAGTLAEIIVDKILYFASGVFHVCSADAVSRIEQARLILGAYKVPGLIAARDANAPSNGCLVSVRGCTVGSVADEVAKMATLEPLEAR